MKFIDRFTKKYSGILRPLQYLIVGVGYVLMISMIWLLGQFLYYYIKFPIIAERLKVPPLIPLVPYLPELFKIDFLPPFYFTYWIIIIAIVAVVHEFSHGIFARLHNIKVHSTGFGFLGPFLAAFVEPDEKQMAKLKTFPQLSILSAGVFANIIVTIIFGLLFWLFFVSAFTPAGVNFNAYSTSVVNLSDIKDTNEFKLVDGINLTKIKSNEIVYLTSADNLKLAKERNASLIAVFDDAPAINAGLKGAIIEFDGERITNYEELRNALEDKKPNDKVKLKTIYNNEVLEYNVELGERNGKAFLGIGVINPETRGIIGTLYSLIGKIKDPVIYYSSKLGDFGWFIYNLLWWLVIINLSVALVNMLPVGIFDGGRFFYLTIFGLTGSKKMSERAFKLSTLIILLVLALLMARWFVSLF